MAIEEESAVEEPSVENSDWYYRLRMPKKRNSFVLSPESSSSEQSECCSESSDEKDEPSEPKSEKKSIRKSEDESKEGDQPSDGDERLLTTLEIEVENSFTKKKRRNPQTGRMKQHLECKLCRFHTSRIYNMRNHAYQHKDVKPFDCDACGASFGQKGNLTRH